jgi:hypothetical protein
VIRRLAARGELPASFHAPIPPSPRLVARDAHGPAGAPSSAEAPSSADPVESGSVALD